MVARVCMDFKREKIGKPAWKKLTEFLKLINSYIWTVNYGRFSSNAIGNLVFYLLYLSKLLFVYP